MTSNHVYCIGSFSGDTYEIFVQAKSIDTLKQKLIKKIENIQKRQNKEKEVKL